MAGSLDPKRSPDNIDDGLIACPICSERYTKPKVLPCFHSFCEECLCRWIEKRGDSNCPTCRTTFDLSADGVSGLKDDILMRSLVNLVTEMRQMASREKEGVCEICEGEEVSHKCLDCCQFLCGGCERAHRKIKATSWHKVISMNEYTGAKSARFEANRPPCCSTHPGCVLQFYCDTCNVPVCLACTVVDHRVPEHLHRNLDVAFQEYLCQLTDIVAELKAKEDVINVRSETVKKSCDDIQWRCCQEQERINRNAEELIADIRTKQQRLVDKLQEGCDVMIEHLHEIDEDLNSKSKNVHNTRNRLEMLMQYGSQARAQLLSTRPDVISRANELCNMKDQYDEESYTYEFVSRTKTMETCLGWIKGELHVPKCTVDEVPRQLWKGDAVSIVIRTRDVRGIDVVPEQRPAATVRNPDGKTAKLDLTNNYDGTHTATIRADMEGEYSVTVTIDDQAIPGSPLELSARTGLVRTVGQHGRGAGEFSHPRGITKDTVGNLAVTDSGNNRVQIFDKSFNYKSELTFPNFKNPFKPQDVAISDDNTYFMTDSGNNQVVVSEEDGRFIRSFGRKELEDPTGIAIHPINRNVYVCSRDSGKVEVYKQDGSHIRTLGEERFQQLTLLGPSFIAISNTGTLYVADELQHCVYACDDQVLQFPGQETENEVKLEFQDFDVFNMDPNCQADYLKVYSGSSSSGRLIGRFCNTNPPPSTIKSDFNELFVIFIASVVQEKSRGFLAGYKFVPIRILNKAENRTEIPPRCLLLTDGVMRKYHDSTDEEEKESSTKPKIRRRFPSHDGKGAINMGKKCGQVQESGDPRG
ncbi:tripartite motif-containing protein 2-like [Ptychodera flava]|uniref:tripartite motif-containing protein 2-like n=1 Tax=Ptychodera flava TaxID=63121 RepID=UPI00396A6CF8